jgi:hypothetical protein
MLSPESRDFLVIERIPDIFHSGHVHVMGYCNYRGVLIVNSGGWQEQTDYMQKLGLIPTPGKVPVVKLQTLETTAFHSFRKAHGRLIQPRGEAREVYPRKPERKQAEKPISNLHAQFLNIQVAFQIA